MLLKKITTIGLLSSCIFNVSVFFFPLIIRSKFGATSVAESVSQARSSELQPQPDC